MILGYRYWFSVVAGMVSGSVVGISLYLLWTRETIVDLTSVTSGEENV